MNALVRRARPEDAPATALVHVRSWQSAYRGVIPDDFLDNMSLEARQAAWAERLQDPDKMRGTFVAESDGKVVGFAAGGAERDGVARYDGELYAIYLLGEYRGLGIGRALAAAVARQLVDDGKMSMLVWVLEANPYRRFYEALGGRLVSEKMAIVAAGNYPEVSYGWPDLGDLVERLERR